MNKVAHLPKPNIFGLDDIELQFTSTIKVREFFERRLTTLCQSLEGDCSEVDTAVLRARIRDTRLTLVSLSPPLT
jgi:hypothetical protein